MTLKKMFMATVAIICSATISFGCAVAAFSFEDVSENVWYYNDVKEAVDNGLINGKTVDLYCPDDYLTYAEAIKLAACMNQLYRFGEITIASGSPWYQPYVDYCEQNGIVDKKYNYDEYVTRAGYMNIFAKALPAEGLAPVNNVPDDSIPDVPSSKEYAEGVYKLYRAGILQGVDDKHNCSPLAKITRAEVAAILTRMMNAQKRVSFSMEETVSNVVITMYAADGRTQAIPESQAAQWEAEGWYRYPVSYVYAMDGRVELIPASDVAAWKAVGWYDTREITMYSLNGAAMEVSLWDVELMKSAGWYTEPVFDLSANYGKTAIFTLSQVENGATVSLEDALVIARNFGLTHMPLSEEDIEIYMEWMDMTRQELVQEMYEPSLLDFNANAYLIELYSFDAMVYVSVNKKTGEARYCGGGQDYMNGWVEF